MVFKKNKRMSHSCSPTLNSLKNNFLRRLIFRVNNVITVDGFHEETREEEKGIVLII